jgi:hypothetical protein
MQANDELTKNERTTHLVEYWKQTTLVQQHFNDISMKVRNFAIVIFSGFLTGVGLSIHNGIFVELLEVRFSAGIIFALAGAFVTQLIHFMDTYWYHIFLKGAVGTTMKIEAEINQILNIDKLADDISSHSQNVSIISLFGLVHFPVGANLTGDSTYTKIKRLFFKEIKVNSTLRHKIFYRWLIVVILLTGVGSLFTTAPTKPKNTELIDSASSQVVSKPSSVVLPLNKNKEDKIIIQALIMHVISASNVRLRLAPDLSASIIDVLPAGKVVKIIDDSNFSWIKVKISTAQQSATGWVYREYISLLSK